MSDSQEQPWSDNPNAPSISRRLYFDKKAYFAGLLISSILYGTPNIPYLRARQSVFTSFARIVLGIMIMLFFQCMAGLFNPVRRKGDRIKWGLVSYTVITFLIATVATVMNLDFQSVSYVDNREFPGVGGVSPPGPLAYQMSAPTSAISIVSNVSFPLNNWLADGLLVSPPSDATFTHPPV